MVDSNSRRTFMASLLAAAAPLQAAANTRRWRVRTPYAAQSFQTAKLETFSERISGLGVSLDIQAGSAISRWPDVLAAVRAGSLEGGELILSSLAAQVPLAAADSVPFVVRSYADARRMWRIQKPLLASRLKAEGIAAVMAVPWPPQGLYCSRPVESLADLRGLRLRTYNKTTVRIAELVQATPVDVPTVKVAEALAEGRIDSMITSSVTGVEVRAWEHLKYYYAINAWIPKNLFFVSEAALGALDARIRESLDAAARDVEDQAWARSEAASEESVRALRAAGMVTGRASSEMLRDLKRLGERFSLEWLREVGPEANSVFLPYFTHT